MGWNVFHKRVLVARFRLALVFASVVFTDDSSILFSHMPGENLFDIVVHATVVAL